MKRDYYILNNGRLSRERNTLFFEKYGDNGFSEGRKPIPVFGRTQTDPGGNGKHSLLFRRK